MKQNHVSPLWQTPLSQETRMRALIRDGFRCRLCSENENLLCHSRTSDSLGSDLDDVITLCETCYALAHLSKQRRKHAGIGVRIAFLACLFFIVSLIMAATSLLSPFMLLAIALASLCIACLVEVSSRVLFQA